MAKFISTYLFVLAVLMSNLTWANISAPPEPNSGNLAGQGSLQSISVVSENLTINLFDVVEGGNAKILASYNLYTSTPIEGLELIFVANNLTESSFLVEIDGAFTNGFIQTYDTVPSSWVPPDSLSFQGTKIPFHYTHEGLISFTIDSISAGKHTLEVSYEARIAEWFEEDDLAMTRAFVYILQPYNGWKEFQNLNLNVFIPSDWEYSSNLELDRHASHALNAFWEEIPAHHFAIVYKPKDKTARTIPLLFVAMISLGSILLLSLWLSRVAKFRLKNNRSKLIQIGNIVLVSILATVIFYWIYFQEPEWKNHLLDNQLNPLYTHGHGYFIFAAPLVWIFSLAITYLVDLVVTQRIKDKIAVSLQESDESSIQESN